MLHQNLCVIFAGAALVLAISALHLARQYRGILVARERFNAAMADQLRGLRGVESVRLVSNLGMNAEISLFNRQEVTLTYVRRRRRFRFTNVALDRTPTLYPTARFVEVERASAAPMALGALVFDSLCQVRCVAPSWCHPVQSDGRPVPLWDGQWLTRDLTRWARLTGTAKDTTPKPEASRYMPAWTSEEASHVQLYSGAGYAVPVSPSFQNARLLVEWLASVGLIAAEQGGPLHFAILKKLGKFDVPVRDRE